MTFFKLLTGRVVTLCLILALTFSYAVHAQVLDSENKLTVVLSDGTSVTLYGTATSLSDEKTNKYYYLPVNPRLFNAR